MIKYLKYHNLQIYMNVFGELMQWIAIQIISLRYKCVKMLLMTNIRSCHIWQSDSFNELSGIRIR